jgi:hypothetical protein
MDLLKKILKWTGIVLVGLFVVAEIIRLPFRLENEKTAEQVKKIHNTKLQLADVLGENLPPDPGAEADKTIEGVDINKNGIRDDVEIAIFKEYPNSAKTRAVLLQYALNLQMQFTQPIVNKEIVTEVVTENSRATACVGDVLVPRNPPGSSRTGGEVDKIFKYIDFVGNLHLNTEARKQYQSSFYKNLGSYSDSKNDVCDIDLSKLSN